MTVAGKTTRIGSVATGRLYKAGPTRKVPGRQGMSWEEEDWVDEGAVRHRCPGD